MSEEKLVFLKSHSRADLIVCDELTKQPIAAIYLSCEEIERARVMKGIIKVLNIYLKEDK